MRFIICFVWTVVYIYITELFPASVRNLALGFSSASGTIGFFLSSKLKILIKFSNIGSAGAPYLKILCVKLSVSPMVPLGVIGIAGVICLLPLPETKG